MGSKSLGTISGRRAGWVKMARLEDISGGDAEKGEPGLLLSTSCLDIANCVLPSGLGP